MLRWLHPDPFEKLLEDIQSQFTQWKPPCTLQSFSVIGFPEWLTSLSPESEKGQREFQSKVGLVFKFNAIITLSDNTSHAVNGVYTWIGCNILETGDVIDRTWIDEEGSLAQFGMSGLLSARLHSFK